MEHVALMGLELMGFAKTNLPKLWVDPLDYQEPLRAAVWVLDRAGVNTSLYNQPLCVLPTDLHPFARKSISDWKNVYFRECEGCILREAYGGFFAFSALKRSRSIAPVRP
ncbi:hypothetical protein [Corallococcus sp. CA049B]|uniref:hypothetical protein n=1 Tax=Corallococcus sp. CA049B TaxID=2316730 RepID=UPI001F38ADA4|nr:hypothetical protein [Corallococcus sp. CA049B]